MPTPQLADTPEPAYNLGRLLAVFESLQDRLSRLREERRRHRRTLLRRRLVRRPRFSRCCAELARHHLSKVRKERQVRGQSARPSDREILKSSSPDRPDRSAPYFKRILTLPEQGIFALGFCPSSVAIAAAPARWSCRISARHASCGEAETLRRATPQGPRVGRRVRLRRPDRHRQRV